MVNYRLSVVILLALTTLSSWAAGGGDTDSDGIANAQDNCVLIANPAQIDSDVDGWGNACDPDFDNNGAVNFLDFAQLSRGFLGNDPALDLDNNGVVNFLDIVRFRSFFLQPPGPAGYANWINPGDGQWNDPANWFPAAIPPAEAVATIDQPGDLTVTFNADEGAQLVAGIVSEETLKLDAPGQSLSVSGDVTSNGVLVLETGTLSVDGTLAANGGVAFEGGTLANAMLTSTLPRLSTTGSVTSFLSAVTLGVDLRIESDSQLSIQNGLTLAQSNIELNAGPSVSFLNLIGASQVIDGTGEIRFTGTTANDTQARIRNLVAPAEVVEIGPDVIIRTISSGGLIGDNTRQLIINGFIISDVPERELLLRGQVTLAGTVQVSNSADFEMEGDWSITATGQIFGTDASIMLNDNWINNGLINASNSQVNFGEVDADSWRNLGTIALSSSPLTLGGTFALADLGNFTHDDTITVVGQLQNTGLTLDLDQIEGSSFTVGNSGLIDGGIVAGSVALEIGPSVASAELSNVTMATDLHVNTSQVLVTNNLTLDNVNVMLNADATFASLNMSGTQTLGGTGEVIFNTTSTNNDTIARIRNVIPGSELTIGSGITVRSGLGGGRVGDANRSLIFNGQVLSNIPGRSITLLGDVLQINGSVLADGGNVILDGNWQSAAASTITVDNGELDLRGTWINNGVIEALNGEVQFGNVTSDNWQNNGSILLTNTPLILDGSFTVANLGSFTTDSSVTVAGVLDNTGNTLDFYAVLGNAAQFGVSSTLIGGVLTSSTPILIGPSVSGVNLRGITLSTDLQVLNNSQIDIEESLVLDSANLILRCDGGIAYANTIGAVSLTGAGEVHFGGTTTNDTQCRVRPLSGGASLTVGSGITVRSTTSGGRLGESSRELILNGAVVSEVPGRQINVLGSPLNIGNSITTNGGDLSIDGAWNTQPGAAVTLNGGEALLQGDWTNATGATISANQTQVQFGANDADSWANLGTLSLIDSPLTLDGTFSQPDLGNYTSNDEFVLTGLLDNAGDVLALDALNATMLRLGGTGKIVGGTITGSELNTISGSSVATLEDVILATDVNVQNASQLDLRGTITLANGRLTANSTGSASYINLRDAPLVTGTGSIDFAGGSVGTSNNRIRTFGATVPVIDSNVAINAINTSGRVGELFAALEVRGHITVDGADQRLLVQGSVLTLEGDLRAINSATLDVRGDWESTANATLTAINASFELSGDWTNSGSITATDSTLEFGNAIADTWNNLGTITLTGSTLDIGGQASAQSVGTLSSDLPVTLSGVFTNTATLDLDSFGGAGLVFDSGAQVLGGVISGASDLVIETFETVTLDDVILNTNVVVNSGGSLNVATGLNLNNVSITLVPTSISFTNLRTQSDVLIDGIGSIIFGGTSTQLANRILVNSANMLTIAENITIQTTTGNGVISGQFATGFQLDGALINTRDGGQIDITVNAPVINGSMSIGATAEVSVNRPMTFGTTAALDMDIDPSSNARLDSTAELTIDGTLNVALQGAVIPGNCEAYTLITYPSLIGGFATFNGPDFLGSPFTLDVQDTQTDVVAPGVGC